VKDKRRAARALLEEDESKFIDFDTHRIFLTESTKFSTTTK